MSSPLSSSANQQTKSKQFAPTTCVLCGGHEATLLFPAKLPTDAFTSSSFSARRAREICHYNIGRCNSCGLVRSLEVLPEDQSLAFYQDSEYLYSSLAPYVAKTYFDLFKSTTDGLINKTDAILEVGCGDGSFLNKLQAEGYNNIFGVDPNIKPALQHFPNLSNRLLSGTTQSLCETHTGQFSIICCFHVIDHLYRPDLFLEECRKLLKPGGLFLCVCHDVESWSAKLLGEHSPIFDIEHVYLFSEKTLPALFELQHFSKKSLGQLKNRYPLFYWMQSLPLLKTALRFLPNKIKQLPISMKAGNLFLLASKN